MVVVPILTTLEHLRFLCPNPSSFGKVSITLWRDHHPFFILSKLLLVLFMTLWWWVGCRCWEFQWDQYEKEKKEMGSTSAHVDFFLFLSSSSVQRPNLHGRSKYHNIKGPFLFCTLQAFFSFLGRGYRLTTNIHSISRTFGNHCLLRSFIII